ncbi:MAG: bifunctional ADP-dependent NAD(P)H-hydrate dehydratase/NAD(P)H-hydrate epimerase [Leptonema sp. (in: Bacteria)]|nr:bifunctional ADP-dependent NAD(P)H-hydrate dehydratase/NAD(P)H-hydrate epimerase [Leptonema sp. (in: bacteria)]
MRSSNGNNLILSRELISFATAAQIDKESIALGNPESLLMGLAASGAYHILKSQISTSEILLLCGSGNNGGDGLALASLLVADPDRQLYNSKSFIRNRLQIFAKLPMRSDASNFYLNRLLRSSVKIQPLTDFTKQKLYSNCSNLFIIDALLGTAQHSPLNSELLTILQRIKELKLNGAKIISLDLPTGLFEDTETNFDKNLETENLPIPDITITFGFEKLAVALNPSLATMKTYTSVCGFEPQVEESILSKQSFRFQRIMAESLTDTYFNNSVVPLFRRNDNSNKYSAGYAYMIAGEYNMEGAALLAVHGFLNSGGGYVRLFHPHIESRERLLHKMPSVLYQTTESFKDFLEKQKLPSVILIGPGISKKTLTSLSDTILDGLNTIAKQGIKPTIILDAAATQLAFDTRYPNELAATTILTPHTGEWSALGASPIHTVDQLNQAIQFLDGRANLLLKGPVTLFVSPIENQCLVFPWPQPNLAVAGSGDTLAGILASACSRNSKIDLTQLVTAAILLQHKSALTTMHPEAQLQKITQLLQ